MPPADNDSAARRAADWSYRFIARVTVTVCGVPAVSKVVSSLLIDVASH
ncbi:hypothetical protein GGQ79_000958 [Ochrobactrum pecoris]|uniref:Uncharacterized protein n=1 Tax=Brucella pecoris TaxID=867683 RepID=A0AB34YMN5_9HYPH|nr:hypothetical protein [Brucella pecoris]MBB4092473.1 hypothetical protein [Brucella pecoris]